MRDAARKIEEKYFSDIPTVAEFLPVEWRSKLTLDEGTLLGSSAAVCKIVPRSSCSVLRPCLFWILSFSCV